MTIGEISKATNISEYTLRYYEKKGLIRVKRDSVGRRIYEESDIEWVKFIQRLYGGDVTMPERLSMLKKHRKYVLEQQTKWKEYLDNLDNKIMFYENSITKK